MKFDYIVIGGGLCGLMAGIRLAESGKKTAVVSSGQSALHFCSGSLGLLGNIDGKEVDSPLEAIKALPADHPYRIAGEEHVARIANEAPRILGEAGFVVVGNADSNHFTLSPMGVKKNAWLTANGYVNFSKKEIDGSQKFLIVAIDGFMESYPEFMSVNLGNIGVQTRIITVEGSRLRNFMEGGMDMRTISVAKHIDEPTVAEFADQINREVKPDEIILFPAVVGFGNNGLWSKFESLVNNPIYGVATIPVSLCGVNAQNALQKYFEQLGGVYLLGDRVEKGLIEDNMVVSLETTNFGDDRLKADKYILAAGSFFGEDIMSNPNGFREEIFGLDVKASENRGDWTNKNFFAPQPYMAYGISVDSSFHPSVNGERIENLYVAGSALAGCNSLKEDSGGGVAVITGLRVAELALGLK